LTRLHFRGVVLPSGESRDLYVVDGRITYEKVAGAETVATGWIVPGLVDAHNHLGMSDKGIVTSETTIKQAVEDRSNGVLLTRDAGSKSQTQWTQDCEDLPRLIRCGQTIARTRRYVRDYAREVEPAGLVGAVIEEALAGDGWVKLIGDWICRDEGDLLPSFPDQVISEAVAAAHSHEARVMVHAFGSEALWPLLRAGVDCIEHGTGLQADHIQFMAESNVALVPTVLQTRIFPGLAKAGRAKFPAYAKTMERLYSRRKSVLLAAYEAGVPIYVGSDGGGSKAHGVLHEEIFAMVDMGLPIEYVLGGASWRARKWLGLDAELEEGTAADFVVYPKDPYQHPEILVSPSNVVLRGNLY